MAGPELSVVCRNCGSEVSPYVTECPYCGTRIRKRAPKLEREGDEIRVREGRREKRARKAAERRRRSSFEFEDLTTRPMATWGILLATAILFILNQALDVDLGAIVGPVDSDYWRYAAAPFLYQHAGYLLVCAGALAIFLPPLERRIGAIPSALLAFASGALGMLAADGLSSSLGNGFPIASGGNGMALGVLAAYAFVMEPSRDGADDGYYPFAVGVAAVVLLALPLVEDYADPWAGLVGGLLGAACGMSARAARRGAG